MREGEEEGGGSGGGTTDDDDGQCEEVRRAGYLVTVWLGLGASAVQSRTRDSVLGRVNGVCELASLATWGAQSGGCGIP